MPPPFCAAGVKFAGGDNGTVWVVDVGDASLRNACVGDGVPVLCGWEEGASKPVQISFLELIWKVTLEFNTKIWYSNEFFIKFDGTQ